MDILVTGAAGFIGFHLAEQLAILGHNVLGLDNINSYYDINLKYGRLAELGIGRNEIENQGSSGNRNRYIRSGRFGNLRFVKCDISDISSLTQVFEDNKFRKVCNLAAQAGVRYSFENPGAYIQSNLTGFTNILELSRKYGAEHFIYASSSSVYGNCDKIPFNESCRTDTPQSIYAATKKSNELLAYVYGTQLGLPVTGLRFFTVYGPWGRPDMAPYIFMKSILEGKPIKVFNNGNLSRDFSYITDIITGIIKVIETDPPATTSIYNIGNSRPVNLTDFIEIIERVTGKKALKEFLPMQKGDVFTTFADTSAIERDYGFSPDTPLEYGIKELYKWYISM